MKSSSGTRLRNSSGLAACGDLHSRPGRCLVRRFAFYLALMPLAGALACGQKADDSDDGATGAGATGGAGAITGANSTQGTGGSGDGSGGATNTGSDTGGAAGEES